MVSPIGMGNPMANRFLMKYDFFWIKTLVPENNFTAVHLDAPDYANELAIKPKALWLMEFRFRQPVSNSLFESGYS